MSITALVRESNRLEYAVCVLRYHCHSVFHRTCLCLVRTAISVCLSRPLIIYCFSFIHVFGRILEGFAGALFISLYAACNDPSVNKVYF